MEWWRVACRDKPECHPHSSQGQCSFAHLQTRRKTPVAPSVLQNWSDQYMAPSSSHCSLCSSETPPARHLFRLGSPPHHNHCHNMKQNYTNAKSEDRDYLVEE